jgi:hypothetical protein
VQKSTAAMTAAPAEGEEVAAEVELVKEEYLVVTLPQHANTLAVLPTKDWNLRLVDVHAAFQPRQRVAAVVHATASPSTGHRLLLAAKVRAVHPSPPLFVFVFVRTTGRRDGLWFTAVGDDEPTHEFLVMKSDD